MKTAKIFLNGRSQAVRLPQEYRFEDKEVYIKKMGEMVILMPIKNQWEDFFDSIDDFSEDFLEKRNQPKLQNRENL